MAIQHTCRHCRHVLVSPRDSQGSSTKCPSCGHNNQVPFDLGIDGEELVAFVDVAAVQVSARRLSPMTIASIVVCVVIIAVLSSALVSRAKSWFAARPAGQTNAQRQEIITAETLAAEFQADLAEASQKHQGKQIVVKGVLVGIGDSKEQGRVLKLRASRKGADVIECRFSPQESANISGLETGDSLLIVGECKVTDDGAVVVMNCRLR